MPMIAPTRTASRTQWRRAPPGSRRDSLQRVDHGSGVAGYRLPRNDASEHHGDTDVEHVCRPDSVAMMPMGTSRRGSPALFACGGDGIEADVGEEDDGAAGENAGPSVGREGMVVRGMDEAAGRRRRRQDGAILIEHHDVVGAGRLADAADEHDGEQNDDEEGGDVEADVPAGG